MSILEKATDARQTELWSVFMQKLGWTVEEIDGYYVFIRKIPLFNHALIKIQHSRGVPPLDKIEEIAKRNNALFVLIEPTSIGYTEDLYKKNGYMRSKMKTAYSANILIDLVKTDQEILESFSENARRNIKKAEKAGITISENLTDDNSYQHKVDMFYELHKMVSVKKKFYIHPYSEFTAKAEAFKDNGFFLFAFQKGEQKPVGAIWFGEKDKTVYYINTGMNEEGYAKNANYLLLWEGIKIAKQKGLEVLDFEGIFDERNKQENKKWKGFTEFKKKFHGETIYYPPSWIKIYNLPYKILYICVSSILRS